ncbi:hypothetical protein HN446_01125 [bacterium]|jgi:hypothetical protein|nr:hypothetical protein [bacterium]
MVNKKLWFLFSTVLFYANGICALPQISVTDPFDVRFDNPKYKKTKWNIGLFAETSLGLDARNEDAEKVNVMQLWQEKQNSLAMIKGYTSSADIGTMQALFDSNGVSDDGIRGYFTPEGKMQWKDLVLAGRYELPYNFSVTVHVPFYFSKLDNVSWTEHTKNYATADGIVKDNLTNSFVANVKKYGDGLDLEGWSRAGFGDVDAMIKWEKYFPQMKAWLKEVGINVKCGVTIPTGLKKDEDSVLSVPFGNDGSFGLVFGGGLGLRWLEHVVGGVQAEFMQQFGNTKERRIKTNRNQTDLLLLTKANVRKSYGFSQHFTVHLGVEKFAGGLSASIQYDHYRHDDDHVSVMDNVYSDSIANTAKSLEEWSLNTLQCNLEYDFGVHRAEEATLKPKISVFYRLPIKARQVVAGHFVGGQISFEF